MDAKFGKEYFKVTDEELKKVISTALENGGDYADLFFQHTISDTIQLRDGTVNNADSNIDFGMGVRVVSGNQTGYAYVENITLQEMLKAAKTAAQIANGNHAGYQVCNLTDIRGTHNYYPIKEGWEEISIRSKIPYLQRLNEMIFGMDKRVQKVLAVLGDSTTHIYFCNSLGDEYYDCMPMATLSTVCLMEENGRIEKGVSTRSFRKGAEFLTDGLISETAHAVVAKASLLFKAIKPKGGEMPVVMASGGSGILLHEAIGHAFEADFNRKKTSIFSDMLHKKICDSNINVIDDGTIPFNRGSINMDDEGVEGQKTYIVKDGILNSYLHDRISAKHYHVKPTGNGRRESFRQIPIPRMRATYMENGNVTEDEIISSVKKGIFASGFTNGQVQIGAGDFTFFVSSGYLIENGRLTQPIKDINIIGNGPQALADITMVGDNLEIDNGNWTCGKDGQSCPVTCGMPTVLVKRLTVGGEN